MSGWLAVLAGTAVGLWTRWLAGLPQDRGRPWRWRPAAAPGRAARPPVPLPPWLRLCHALPLVPAPLGMAVEPLATALARAGLGSRDEAERLARRLPALGLVTAAGGCALGAWVSGPASLPGLFPALAAAGVGAAVAARHAIDRAARRRQARLLAELPVVVDLLVLGLEGGLNVRQTLELVARHAPPAWQGLLEAAVRQVEHGLPMARALAGLRAHVAPGPGRTVLRALAVAERAGVGPVPLLRRQAEYAQQVLERRWQAQVGALPVQLMVVGLLLLFPPVLVVLLLPNVLTFLQSRW